MNKNQSIDEFGLIEDYFNHIKNNQRKDVIMGIGDDCAIITTPAHQQLAITTDTLVEGIHFLPDISPADLAYKSIAVNLSDLASMGATPAWISLALTLPSVDKEWLRQFSQSFFDTLNQYDITLIGGNTTKGPRSLTITAQGYIYPDQVLYRHTANIGDAIFVSGTLGDSAAGLHLLQSQHTILGFDQFYLCQRHLRPTPQIVLGQIIAPFANAAIDISDGLLSDLSHILKRSQCGAMINLDALPFSPSLLNIFSLEQAERFALTGGEDYEICFTISEAQRHHIEKRLLDQGINITCIGEIRPANEGIRLLKQNQAVPLPIQTGFNHFQL